MIATGFRHLLAYTALCFALESSALAESYRIGDYAVGERVDTRTSNFRSFVCSPSDTFDGAVWCKSAGRRRDGSMISRTLLHASDGTALYLMSNEQRVRQGKSAVEIEVDAISRSVGLRPATVEWQEGYRGTPTTVIATWGDLKLHPIDSEATATIAEGRSPRLGILVDKLGDQKRSAESSQDIYRITGGRGYVFSASFDRAGMGHRHHVAIDAAETLVSKYRIDLAALLVKDAILADNDYALWPNVAALTRTLSVDTSPAIANRVLDEVFETAASRKLKTHLWAILPGSIIYGLSNGEYRREIDFYGPDTQYPEIRRALLAFLNEQSDDPFVHFAHYANGDLQKALTTDRHAVASQVYHYAIGHSIVAQLAIDAIEIAKRREPDADLDFFSTSERIAFLNQNPEYLDYRPLGQLISDFASRSQQARLHFEAVARHEQATHADDANYMLGWLAMHEGRDADARAYFTKALLTGNGDYASPGALKQMVRLLERMPQREQLAIVSSDPTLAKKHAMWYVVARSAYRAHDYAAAVTSAEKGLSALGIPLWQLPVTTDPRRIEAALGRVDPELRISVNLVEIPYLLFASKEIQRYLSEIAVLDDKSPSLVATAARRIIKKFSKLIDEHDENGEPRAQQELRHKDLRQAIHLIDRTLAMTPATAAYANLRQWLHYRKIRCLVSYYTKGIEAAVADLEEQYPGSELLDDALVEKMIAHGIVDEDLAAMEATFRVLLARVPSGNALDNAHSWMAIALQRAGLCQEARAMNKEIIMRFPLTRHALYAIKRLATFDGNSCRN